MCGEVCLPLRRRALKRSDTDGASSQHLQVTQARRHRNCQRSQCEGCPTPVRTMRWNFVEVLNLVVRGVDTWEVACICVTNRAPQAHFVLRADERNQLLCCQDSAELA